MPGSPLSPFNPCKPGAPGPPFVALVAFQTLDAWIPLVTLQPLGALNARISLVALVTFQADRTQSDIDGSDLTWIPVFVFLAAVPLVDNQMVGSRRKPAKRAMIAVLVAFTISSG